MSDRCPLGYLFYLTLTLIVMIDSYIFLFTDVEVESKQYLSLFILALWTVLYKFSRNHHILELLNKVFVNLYINPFQTNGPAYRYHKYKSLLILGPLGGYLFSILNRTFCKQTMKILIRHFIMWCLIWVCPVCYVQYKGSSASNNSCTLLILKIQKLILSRSTMFVEFSQVSQI